MPTAKALRLFRQWKKAERTKMKDIYSDLPDGLEWLLRKFAAEVDRFMAALKAGTITVPEWLRVFSDALTDYYEAAFMIGNDAPVLTTRWKDNLIPLVQVQVDYLKKFGAEIQTAEEWKAGWEARARMYASSIKVPYWQGKVKVLPLPAMPAENTTCLSNCKCRWHVITIDADKGDYDAYWQRHAEDSCQTCLQRAAEWNPVRIRGGALQLD